MASDLVRRTRIEGSRGPSVGRTSRFLFDRWVLLRKLKAEGYDIHFFFGWLKNVDLALSRVKERVSRGGHDVPEPVVRRRFDRSMQNFLLY
jgi:predicted ABC-type ATPase